MSLDHSKKEDKRKGDQHESSSKKLKNDENVFAGFSELSGGVIRMANGQLSFVETVTRIADLIPKYLKPTPQYHYELLSQAFNCKAELKLENLQLFGDIYVRNCLGIIFGNYFNEVNSISRSIAEVPGLVIVLDPAVGPISLQFDGIVLTALHINLKSVIYVAPGKLSPLHCTQLHSCHERGAKVIFHKGDLNTCYQRAKQHAQEMRMIYIEQNYNPQFSLLGAATVAYEMAKNSPNMETVVIPLRLYSIGWSYVAGISILLRLMNPSIRVCVVRMTEDLVRLDEEGQSYDRQSLFPDVLEMGWMALVTEEADLRFCFDKFDARNLGKVDQSDLQAVITNMGGDATRFPVSCPKSSLSLTEFIKNITKERLDFSQTLLTTPEYKDFFDYISLDRLLKDKTVNELVEVTEDEAALAFIRCLEYTHTLTNGKGAVALAGLWSGKIQPKKDEKLVVMIMGGYVDVIHFQNILDYGLQLTGQSFELSLDLPDNTTALSKVLQAIASHKASVYEVSVDRNVESLRQFHVRATIQCKSKNFEQQRLVCDTLTQQGFMCKIESKPSPYDVKKVAEANTAVPSTSPIVSKDLAESKPKENGNGNEKEKSENTPLPPRQITDVTVQSIQKAYERICPNLSVTPIYKSSTYSKLSGCELYLMLENIQKVGSFKIRGSSNMVLKTVEESKVGATRLICASAGNHAQGVALISAKVGIPCTIVCPEYAPETKLQWTRMYGAEVLKVGNSLEEAARYAEQLCDQNKWLMVRPFNDVDVIEGQGTMGKEIYDQIPDVDTVVVNVGGGGMIAGIALYLKGVNPNIRIVGVQSQNVAPLADFKTTHEFRYIEPTMQTLADGTNVKRPGGIHTNILRDLVDEYVTVSENEIASTIVHLMTNSRTISEGAGCLGLAAILHRKIQVRKDEKVCVVICGGNIDMSTLRQVYEYGLRNMGRSFTIHLTTWDYPGNLSKIISLAARAELTVREMKHIRGFGDINWNECTISISFYSNSFHHQVFFLNLLVEEGFFPEIIGRKYIKDHQTIYSAFEEAVEAKKAELNRTHKERQEVFLQQFRAQQQAQSSTVI